MKQFLTILLVFTLNTVFAQQRITVIDKSAENALLFDEQNPQSLVGLFNRNSLPFNPMSLTTSIRLMEKGLLENASLRYGRQSNYALANADGEDSMAVINGVLQFVYPMPDIYYTDFHDISRILLYEHDTISNGKQEYLIDSIGYAKKYDSKGKYELAGTIDFKTIDNTCELFYIEQLSTASFQQLISDGFWLQLKSSQLAQSPVQTKPILNWDSGLSKDYYSFIFDILQPNRPRHGYWNNRDFHWPISSGGIINNRLSDLEKHYGKSSVHGIPDRESDIPLANIYGEDSMIIQNGVMQFVYPEPEFHVSWIDVQPTKAWLIYSVSSESLVPKNWVARIVFTQGEENKLLADFNCSDSRISKYSKFLEDTGIQLEVPVQENWKMALLKARLAGKNYSVSKKGDIKKLAKEFEVIEDVIK
jgi:hypothetical protein